MVDATFLKLVEDACEAANDRKEYVLAEMLLKVKLEAVRRMEFDDLSRLKAVQKNIK